MQDIYQRKEQRVEKRDECGRAYEVGHGREIEMEKHLGSASGERKIEIACRHIVNKTKKPVCQHKGHNDQDERMASDAPPKPF